MHYFCFINLNPKIKTIMIKLKQSIKVLKYILIVINKNMLQETQEPLHTLEK